MKSPVTSTSILKFVDKQLQVHPDLLVTEEPLEIRLKVNLEGELVEKRLSVTMRTPGHDFELAIGFLLTEGIIRSYSDVQKIFYCEDLKSDEELGNVVVIVLDASVQLSTAIFDRNFYMTSSCGVCGKSSIESIHVSCTRELNPGIPTIHPSLIANIPELVSGNQTVFTHTGGLHAAALLNPTGEVVLVREDVGRHNALDKLVGARTIDMKSNEESVLFVSGRVSFELVQKAFVAGIPIMVAVGAPSSLAIELAKDCRMTVIGFTRNGKFNIYCGKERVIMG